MGTGRPRKPPGASERPFARWLRNQLAINSMTQMELASRLGIPHRSNISHWLHYGQEPEKQVLLNLAAVFNTSPEYLYSLLGIEAKDTSDAHAESIWIPLIENFEAPIDPNKAVGWVPDTPVESDQVFAVTMPAGGRLSPVVVPGDVLIAHRQGVYQDGDVVILRDGDGTPQVWRAEQQGRSWAGRDADGIQTVPLGRSAYMGVMLALIRKRNVIRWPEVRRQESGPRLVE